MHIYKQKQDELLAASADAQHSGSQRAWLREPRQPAANTLDSL